MLNAVDKIHKPLLLSRMVSETLKLMKYSKDKHVQLEPTRISAIVTHLVEMHQLIDSRYLKFIERLVLDETKAVVTIKPDSLVPLSPDKWVPIS